MRVRPGRAEEKITDGRGAARRGDFPRGAVAVVIAMALGAGEIGPAARRRPVLHPRPMTSEAGPDAGEEDVVAVLRSPGAPGIGAGVALPAVDAPMGLMVE